MDKKNTILLTVIAVATLLVAVVGATFAYFSVANEGSSSTVVTAQTPAANSTITVEQGTAALTLTLAAEDMAKAKQDTTYYATTDAEQKAGDASSTGVYFKASGEYTKASLGKVTISSPVAGAEYVCHYSVTVTDNTAGDKIADLYDHKEDVIFKLYGNGVDTSKNEKEIPLNALTTPITFDVDLTAEGINAKEQEAPDYYVEFAIKNTGLDQKEYLKEKNYKFTVNTTINCEEKTED